MCKIFSIVPWKIFIIITVNDKKNNNPYWMARLTTLFSKYNNIVLVILCSCMKKCDTLRSKITFPRFLAHPLKSHCVCLVAESCPTLCDSMDCSLPGSSVPGDSPGNNTGVGCPALLQGIFSTQGSNLGILHCGRILYQLRYQLRFFISPRILEWVAYPFSRGSSWPRNWIGVCTIAYRFFTSWATRKAPNHTIVTNTDNSAE